MLSQTVKAVTCLTLSLLPTRHVLAQGLPADSDEAAQWGLWATYHVAQDDPGPFDRRGPDVELAGLRLRRAMSNRTSLDAGAAFDFDSSRLGRVALSAYHTLRPFDDDGGLSYSLGPEAGVTWFDDGRAVTGLHGQLWSLVRLAGGDARNVVVGARVGAWHSWPEESQQKTDLNHGLGVILTVAPILLQFEMQGLNNAAFGYRRLYTFQVGARW